MAWYGVAPDCAAAGAAAVRRCWRRCWRSGLGLLLAALNVTYRDFRYVVPFIVQLGLFVSPVAFATVAGAGALARCSMRSTRWSAIIDGFRWSHARRRRAARSGAAGRRRSR